MDENKKPEDRKFSSVVSKPAELKKKGGFGKLKGLLISEDAKDVKGYILGDVIIPTIKKMISEAASSAIDILLFGETRRRNGSSSTPGSRVSYRKYYDDRDYRDSRDRRRDRYEVFDYDNLEFDNKGDAEMVLDSLIEVIEQYKMATVGDAYDFAGVSTNSYMVNRYGWSDLSSARIVRDRDHYYIDFPKPMPID